MLASPDARSSARAYKRNKEDDGRVSNWIIPSFLSFFLPLSITKQNKTKTFVPDQDERDLLLFVQQAKLP